MIYDKCPWCGKKVKRNDIKRAHKRKTPSALRFARCNCCDNYYGQSYFTKRSAYYLIFSLVLFTIICLTNFLPLILCLCFCFWCIIKGPFLKMTENEEIIKEKKCLFKGKIISPKNKIKKYHYYYLDPKFDSYDAFCTVSPIEIHEYNKKNNDVVFSFLYEHKSNYNYITNNIILYNYQGDFAVAMLKTTHQQAN